MTNKPLFILLIFFLLAGNVRADMGPKIDNSAYFELWQGGHHLIGVDSIAVISYSNWNDHEVDTIWKGKQGSGPRSYLWYDGRSPVYRISGHVSLVGYKVIVFLSGKRYESGYISTLGDRTYFKFSLQEDGSLKDISPLFYRQWSEYFRSLIFTIVLELLVTLVFWLGLKGRLRSFILVQLICNCITHPILWYIDSHWMVNILYLELGVIIVECLILSLAFRKKVNPVFPIAIGIIANMVSWIIGGILGFIFF